MLERIRDFLTGGEEFARRRERLHKLDKQNHHRRLSQREVDEYKNLDLSVGRRLLLARGGISLVTATAVGGIGLFNLDRILRAIHGVDPSPVLADTDNRGIANNPDNQPVSAKGAESIRQQIRQFEEEKANEPITKESVGELFRLTPSLYKETFGKPALPFTLVVLTYDAARRLNLPESKIRVPNGRVFFSAGQRTTISIYLGREDVSGVSEPTRLQALKAVIMHEFMYAQTTMFPEQGMVTVGMDRFQPKSRIGFQWFMGLERSPFYKATYFDIINAQLLAQYLNDPTGQDQLFRKIAADPNYRVALPHTVVEGAKILGRIYDGLGITVEEIEALRSQSQSEVLLGRIDSRCAQFGVRLARPASSVLINLNPQDEHSDIGLKPLRDLLSKLPPTL